MYDAMGMCAKALDQSDQSQFDSQKKLHHYVQFLCVCIIVKMSAYLLQFLENYSNISVFEMFVINVAVKYTIMHNKHNIYNIYNI